MIKRIKDILNQDDDPPPSQISEIIHELNNSIETITNQIDHISLTLKDYSSKLENCQSEKNQCQQKAKDFFKKEDSIKAEEYWKRAQILDQKIIKYQSLLKSIEVSQTKLFSQKTELEYNVDKLTTRLQLGKIDASTSQIHAETLESMMLLQNSGALDEYDEIILDAESKSEALREMIGSEGENNITAENTDSDTLGSIKEEIDKDKQEKEAASINRLKVKYDHFFKPDEKNLTSEELAHKKNILSQFKEAKTSKTEAISNFFKTENPQAISEENQDRIKDFFRSDE